MKQNVLDNLPENMNGIRRLFSWSENYDFPSPATLFLDLIGWSDETHGETMFDMSKVSERFEYLELDMLADALKEYAAYPSECMSVLNSVMTDVEDVDMTDIHECKHSNNNVLYVHGSDSPFCEAVYDAMTKDDNPSRAHTFLEFGRYESLDLSEVGSLYGWHTLDYNAWCKYHSVRFEDWGALGEDAADWTPWPKTTVEAKDGQTLEVPVL